jgi:hypothetical protein
VEATKPITPTEVAVARTLKAGGGVWHGGTVHRHPCCRSRVPSHPRRRSRDRENALDHTTEENKFFPVHNFMGF